MPSLRTLLEAIAEPRGSTVVRGVACEGTSLEATTFAVAPKKVFLFMRSVGDGFELRLKLGESLRAAKSEAKARPDTLSVGANGWAKLVVAPGDAGSLRLAKAWISESRALFAKPSGARQSAAHRAATSSTRTATN